MRWWLGLTLIWVTGVSFDRLWLTLDQRLPNWDHADYLNSAVDHGRALGLLAGGGWPGWQRLLDLSPKIPPLASLVHGTLMALAGDHVDQALWANALWWAVLLVAAASWGRLLQGPAFGLQVAALLTVAPGLMELRTKFSLDLALTAATTWSLWQLALWRRADPQGGRWSQALICGASVAGAVLIKQSALLVLLPPCTWLLLRSGSRRRRVQAVAASLLAMALCLPWLQHNWITTLSGTNRAVIESAAREGDPSVLSLASWLHYPLLLPDQIGVLPLLIGLLGAATGLWRVRKQGHLGATSPAVDQGIWLVGTTLSALLFITLSPNKDSRYLAPVLPMLVIGLSWGWWQLLQQLRHRHGRATGILATGGAMAVCATIAGQQAWSRIDSQEPPPLESVIRSLRQRTGGTATTVMTVVSTAEINQHTVTYLGRRNGGRIVGRQLAVRSREFAKVRPRVEWLVLAPGRGDLSRRERALHRAVRRDPTFRLAQAWNWSGGRLELWQRASSAPPPQRFDEDFIRLARSMERGVGGVAAVFDRIGLEHSLDGHFLYQERIQSWAEQRLRLHPDDRNALWSLALLQVLRNRPLQAEPSYARLQRLDPENPWPSLYRSVVLLAAWRPWSAVAVLAGNQRPPQMEEREAAILRDALLVLSRTLGGDLRQLPQLKQAYSRGEQAIRNTLPEDNR